jgi:hypothetical protein
MNFSFPESGQSPKAAEGRDLPDAGGPGFLTLNGRIGANPSLIGRRCVKTKTELAVYQFCKIQTSKSRRFESHKGFFARFAQIAKVPKVFTLGQ